MKILVTETREYVVEVDVGKGSTAARRCEEFNCSALDVAKWLAQQPVMNMRHTEVFPEGQDPEVQVLCSRGFSYTARGMSSGEADKHLEYARGMRSPENRDAERDEIEERVEFFKKIDKALGKYREDK